MSTFVKGLLVAAVLFGFYNPRGEAEPTIQARLEPARRVHSGQTSLLTVQAEWKSEEADYRFTQPEVPLEGFVLEAIGESGEVFQKEGKEWQRKTFRYTLRAGRSGIGRIHSFRVDYVDPTKGIGGHFDVRTLESKIVSDHSGIYWGIASAILLAASGFWGWGLFVQSKKNRRNIQAVEPTLEDRYVSSLAELEKTIKTQKPGRNEVFEAGKLFRSYLSERYSVPGGLATSREMIEKIESQIPPEELKTLKRIFDRLDEWSYSDHRQSIDEGNRLYQEMIRYVEGKKIIAA